MIMAIYFISLPIIIFVLLIIIVTYLSFTTNMSNVLYLLHIAIFSKEMQVRCHYRVRNFFMCKEIIISMLPLWGHTLLLVCDYVKDLKYCRFNRDTGMQQVICRFCSRVHHQVQESLVI